MNNYVAYEYINFNYRNWIVEQRATKFGAGALAKMRKRGKGGGREESRGYQSVAQVNAYLFAQRKVSNLYFDISMLRIKWRWKEW